MPTIPPLISVIIPCYQQAHFLAEAIDSVLAQTHPRHEVIVVDDGSSDGAGEIVKRYPMVRYLRQDNLGVSSARNRGMAVCGGDYVVFLDADDRLLPNALEVGLEYFQAHPEAALVFGRCRLIGPDGSPSPELQPPCAEAVDYGDFLGGNQIWHPAEAMVQRFVLESGMVFDTGLANASDFAFYLDLARRWPIRSHNVLVSEYRQHSSNKTKDVPKNLMVRPAHPATPAGIHNQQSQVRGDLSGQHQKAQENLLPKSLGPTRRLSPPGWKPSTSGSERRDVPTPHTPAAAGDTPREARTMARLVPEG
jgi:hypothetical protein